jgi:putative ABC transport system permease protein
MYFVTFILKNLTRRPTRTALTVLGLSVAVGSMIALLGISDQFRRSVTEGFEKRGVDLVVVPGGQADQLSGKIDEWVVDRVRKMKGVKWVDAAIVDVAEMWRRDPKPGETSPPPSMQVMIQAWAPENFEHDDLEIMSGRRLTPGDTGKVMLGSTLAVNLNKKVGDKVTLLGKPFEVVGIYKSFLVFETGALMLPLAEYQKEIGAEGKVTGFSLAVEKGADPEADVERVRQQILDLKSVQFRLLYLAPLPILVPDVQPVRLAAEPPRQYAENASHLKVTNAMAWVVSLVAILIGVISMVNTMAMSVLERTQEIGILRAVGWPSGRVIRMVLGEAVCLAVAAASIGTAGAVATTYALSYLPRTSGFIEGGLPLPVVGIGFAITVAIGLLGGAYPAFRAARLLPTEAIRHD